MIYSKHADCSSYITKDGSSIRELMHPDIQGNQAQSLAEAVVAPGQETITHKHIRSEEIYHITGGSGRIVVGREYQEVQAGDTVAIPAGTYHSVKNTGDIDLVIICACTPPYAHGDTEISEG